MKPSLVFYAAQMQLTKDHAPIIIAGEVAAWVRAEAFLATDASSALDKANPLRGETVLNSVDFDS